MCYLNLASPSVCWLVVQVLVVWLATLTVVRMVIAVQKEEWAGLVIVTHTVMGSEIAVQT